MTPAAEVRDLIVQRTEETGFGAHGLHVLIGDEIAEHRWAPDDREEIHSVAKALCVLAAGIAADEGVVSLDDRVVDLLPIPRPGADVDRVTLRHLLTMSSGVDLPYSETMMTEWPDLAEEFLSRPSRGRVFQYSNASTYTAMAALAARVGDVADYLAPRLFTPLGLDGISWERSPRGRVIAGAGVSLRTEEMSRLGRLIRDRGEWHGERLVSAAVIDAMHSAWVVAGSSPGYDRYALAGWGGPGDGWRLHGAYGQLIVFAGDGVVTISADDHFGADAMAAYVVECLTR
ncbi:serine hydrolase [Microbacterium sp. C5A9]|uniref:serine hydrolase domain-containing protein n=1 Tax=Microbacterium sp. C5A9 TaxID=2736663 RepID=UPI001F51C830|nr:serine hydrolase [Microbacterium sp. C5A9]MCI1017808.1 serine hydrolase [Microbacterium sp. C5A9]